MTTNRTAGIRYRTPLRSYLPASIAFGLLALIIGAGAGAFVPFVGRIVIEMFGGAAEIVGGGSGARGAQAAGSWVAQGGAMHMMSWLFAILFGLGIGFVGAHTPYESARRKYLAGITKTWELDVETDETLPDKSRRVLAKAVRDGELIGAAVLLKAPWKEESTVNSPQGPKARFSGPLNILSLGEATNNLLAQMDKAFETATGVHAARNEVRCTGKTANWEYESPLSPTSRGDVIHISLPGKKGTLHLGISRTDHKMYIGETDPNFRDGILETLAES